MTHKARHTTQLHFTNCYITCADAATNPCITWQSHPAPLVPFASLSAISGTFNSLSKVLFTFPSWYLFPIGPKPIFSFRWKLPPTLRSNPEERDSQKTHRAQGDCKWKAGLSPSVVLFSKRLTSAPLLAMRHKITSQSHKPQFPL